MPWNGGILTVHRTSQDSFLAASPPIPLATVLPLPNYSTFELYQRLAGDVRCPVLLESGHTQHGLGAGPCYALLLTACRPLSTARVRKAAASKPRCTRTRKCGRHCMCWPPLMAMLAPVTPLHPGPGRGSGLPLPQACRGAPPACVGLIMLVSICSGDILEIFRGSIQIGSVIRRYQYDQ